MARPDELVRLAIASDEIEAHIWRDALEQEGIRPLVRSRSAFAAMGGLGLCALSESRQPALAIATAGVAACTNPSWTMRRCVPPETVRASVKVTMLFSPLVSPVSDRSRQE